MTEYEKMLNGFFYNGDDPQLMKMWYKGKRLIHLFNQLPADCLRNDIFYFHNYLERPEKIFGLFLHFLWIMVLTYISETIVK